MHCISMMKLVSIWPRRFTLALPFTYTLLLHHFNGSDFMTPRSKVLENQEVLEKIKFALDHRCPCSIVRIGDGENHILAQNSVWSMKELLKEGWVTQANKGTKGVNLPNLLLRDQMLEAIKKADVVGILKPDDKTILAPKRIKRELTDKIFAHYNLRPPVTCDALVFRALIYEPMFWKFLKGKRVLLITRNVAEVAALLRRSPYKLSINMMLHFDHYDQMENTLKKISIHKDQLDIALIACGVNAVVLAHKVAELSGKVGIDIGKAMTKYLP